MEKSRKDLRGLQVFYNGWIILCVCMCLCANVQLWAVEKGARRREGEGKREPVNAEVSLEWFARVRALKRHVSWKRQ